MLFERFPRLGLTEHGLKAPLLGWGHLAVQVKTRYKPATVPQILKILNPPDYRGLNIYPILS